MRLLVRRPGLSVNDTAAELGIAPPNISAAVRSLVARGELERRPDPVDRRVVRLHPTDAAMAGRRAQEEAWGRALDEVLSDVPAADRELLSAAVGPLGTLAEALSRRVTRTRT
jgi:DNA-binding MarR family transcriptional regulator